MPPHRWTPTSHCFISSTSSPPPLFFSNHSVDLVRACCHSFFPVSHMPSKASHQWFCAAVLSSGNVLVICVPRQNGFIGVVVVRNKTTKIASRVRVTLAIRAARPGLCHQVSLFFFSIYQSVHLFCQSHLGVISALFFLCHQAHYIVKLDNKVAKNTYDLGVLAWTMLQLLYLRQARRVRML